MVALNLGNVYISVRINEWNNAFYNALQLLEISAFMERRSWQGHLVDGSEPVVLTGTRRGIDLL